jgi:uncharacterized protein Yka (UPF0111/DUF47 family)
LVDWLFLSLYEQLVNETSDLEEKCDKVIEDLVRALHEDLDAKDSIEYYAFHHVLE